VTLLPAVKAKSIPLGEIETRRGSTVEVPMFFNSMYSKSSSMFVLVAGGSAG